MQIFRNVPYFGKCNLCGNITLLCKSHIFPESIVKLVQGKIEPMFVISRDHFEGLSTPEYSFRMDFCDSTILCKQCDREKIGVYEDYGRRILFPLKEKNNTYKDNPIRKLESLKYGAFETFSQVDYKRFKLFILSMLYKSNITQSSKYGDVNLDLVTNRRLHKMLYNGDAGFEYEFQFRLHKFTENEGPTEFIIPFMKVNKNFGLRNLEGYICGFGGYVIFIQTRWDFLVQSFNEGTVKKSGSMMIKLEDKNFAEEFLRFIANYLKMFG